MKKSNLFLFIIPVLLYACDGSRNTNFDMGDIATKEGYQSPGAPSRNAPAEEGIVVNDEIAIDRKVIKTGDITFETNDVNKTRQNVLSVVEAVKGYVANDNVYDLRDRIQHSITVRVPANRFDELLDKITAQADRIENQNVNTQDVTEEYIDIEARIATKKELENRYKELLKKATKVEEMITIEREMGNLRTEIESIERRLKYLSDRVSYSTLTITFYERTTSAVGFNTKFTQALKNGWNYFMLFLIGLVNIWPFILAALIVLFAIRMITKRNRNRVN